ncbi:MAG: hypothetical protein JSW61_13010 [Candidatus Thorarchaeota archaeon]|nr:MAG: hypothetical protein JSW61_13010 [Candidatus Thorarchaeota archaeon]
MTLEPSIQEVPRGRAAIRYAYIVFSIAVTSLTAFVLSIAGYIPLNPISAAVTGAGAGLALVIFQIYYVSRIVAMSRRIKLDAGLE